MIDAEVMALSQMLLDPKCATASDVREEDFSTEQGRRTFRAINQCLSDGAPVEPGPLLERGLSSDDILTVSGKAPSSANFDYYAEQIVKASKQRKLVAALEGLLQDAREYSADVIVDRAVTELTDIAKRTSMNRVKRINALTLPFTNELERRYHSKELPGISTGMPQVDRMINGFRDGYLYYIGGRPSDGKSALMLSFAINAARAGESVGVISLENSETEIMERLFSSVSLIDSRKMVSANFGKTDWVDLVTAGEELHRLPIYLYSDPRMTASDVRAVSRQMVHMGCGMVFVDYLQYIRWDKGTREMRQHIIHASNEMKAIARELQIPVVCCAQLGRQAEGRHPVISDFMESGALEQDADVAMMLYHDHDDSWLCVVKARDGATGDIQVVFDRPHVRFLERER